MEFPKVYVDRPRARNDAIWHDGFSYHTTKRRTTSGGEVRYLVCKDRFCPATASVKPNGDFNLGRRTHTHPKDGMSERLNRFKRNLRATLLERPSASIKTIYNEVASLYPQAALYCPYTSMEGSMRRWRANVTDNGLPVAATVDYHPVKDSPDVAPADDDLVDSNDSDSAPVDDFKDDADAASVNDLQNVATYAFEPLVAANPAAPDVAGTSNRQCVNCHLNNRTHILIPCGHYGICDDCVQMLNVCGNQQCIVCRRPMHSIMRVLEC